MEEHLCTKNKAEPKMKQRHKLVEDMQCCITEFGPTVTSLQSHWHYLGRRRPPRWQCVFCFQEHRLVLVALVWTFNSSCWPCHIQSQGKETPVDGFLFPLLMLSQRKEDKTRLPAVLMKARFPPSCMVTDITNLQRLMNQITETLWLPGL